MAYEFLKKFFGTPKDGEEPKAMTYEELEAAIDADKKIQVVDLKAGGYVSKDKLDAKITELDGVKRQLDDANKEIQSYKDMDVEGIKQSVKDWELKYNTDTKALQDKLDAQATEFAAKEYMSKFQFTSPLAAKAAMSEFMAQEFRRDESGKFLGADDFMESMKESNPGAFVVETPPADPNPAPPKPSFAPTTPPTPPKSGKKMTLTEKMKYMADHPETDVNSLFDE